MAGGTGASGAGGDYSPGGTGAGGGIASLGGTNNIQNSETDNSNAAANAQYNYGANLNVSEGASLTYTGSDYGAIQAGLGAFALATQLAESSVESVAKLGIRGAEAQQEITDRSIDLAKAAQQGEGGTLIHGLIWLFGIIAFGVVGWAAFTKKKEAKNA